MNTQELGRAQKLFVDRDGLTFSEANSKFLSRTIQLHVGSNWQRSNGATAAILTATNCAVRAFGGGVDVLIENDGLIQSGWGNGKRLSEVVRQLGGSLVTELKSIHLTIAFCGPSAPLGEVIVYATWSGWRGGVVTNPDSRLDESKGNALSGALAGSVAVSECFQNAFHGPEAGRREAGLSLWQPGRNWLESDGSESPLQYLPASIWIAGLGHLGQAYSWLLGLMDFPTARKPKVLLQDIDSISEGNLSTSLLSTSDDLRQKKTRVVSQKLTERGFETVIVERLFDQRIKKQDSEPDLILSGFDNYEARRALGHAGFEQVVDAGLGSGADNYLDIIVQSFQGEFASQVVYADPVVTARPEKLGTGYERELAARITAGEDEATVRCGIIEIAGIAVGASFVGLVASALVLAEVLRPLNGGQRNDLVHANLEFLDGTSCTKSSKQNPSRLDYIESTP